MIKKIIILLLMFLFIPINLNANEYDDYEYTSSKQDNGLTYELTKVDLTTTSLYLEGWAYIPDAQHYKNNNDIKITIMSYESGGKETYYNTNITNKYDLTLIEKINQADYCADNIYNQPPDKCAYYYKYVSFNVTIPLSEFSFPNTYEFYIFVEAKDANIKRYTKLYSPDVEDSIVVGNFKYSFISDVEDTDLIVNDPNVFVRTSPEKTDNYFVLNGCTYYWKENEAYTSSSKTFNHPLTWYNMDFYASSTAGYNGCLATSGTQSHGYIASNFVDFQGYGNSTLTIEFIGDISFDLIAIPTINQTDDIIITLNILASNLVEPISVDLKINYAEYEQVIPVNVENNTVKEIEIIIDNQYYQQGAPITLELVINDTNNENNKVVIQPIYASETTQTIDLKSGQNLITFSCISGIAYQNNEIKNYYETTTINITPPIENIQSELNNYENEFEGFYAGGAFYYDIKINTQNEYPYKYTNVSQTSPTLEISDAYIDNPKETIDYVFEDNTYKLEPVYITQDNKVTYDKPQNSLYEEGKNVIYTSFDLKNGKYEFKITIDDIGVNNIDLVINSYFVVDGILFSHTKDALLYYRSISPLNPMPNYSSNMWENYDLEEIFDEQNIKEIDIYLTASAKTKIKAWVEEDYQNNINNNDDEFKKLIDELIQNNEIIITEET